MKILKLLLALSALLILTISINGCSTRTVYVDRPYKVVVETPCRVKDVDCNLSNPNLTDTEVVVNAGKCIVDLKREAKVCQ